MLSCEYIAPHRIIGNQYKVKQDDMKVVLLLLCTTALATANNKTNEIADKIRNTRVQWELRHIEAFEKHLDKLKLFLKVLRKGCGDSTAGRDLTELFSDFDNLLSDNYDLEGNLIRRLATYKIHKFFGDVFRHYEVGEDRLGMDAVDEFNSLDEEGKKAVLKKLKKENDDNYAEKLLQPDLIEAWRVAIYVNNQTVKLGEQESNCYNNRLSKKCGKMKRMEDRWNMLDEGAKQCVINQVKLKDCHALETSEDKYDYEMFISEAERQFHFMLDEWNPFY